MKDRITVQPATAWVEILEHKRPELFAYGRNYAIECVVAEACKLPHPLPPSVRIQQGAETRGKAIASAAKRSRKSKSVKS